jgi:hypothetical protein
MTLIVETIKQDSNEKRHYEIFVADIKEIWDRAIVVAKGIIERAGFSDAHKYVLEALDRPGGKPVAEFEPNAPVDLADKERKFFRVTPGGGGRS